jgi:hypothetical protein
MVLVSVSATVRCSADPGIEKKSNQCILSILTVSKRKLPAIEAGSFDNKQEV